MFQTRIKLFDISVFMVLVFRIRSKLLFLLGDFNNYWKRCQHIMKKHGLSKRFPGAVAHGVHSITLEDIQHYFKPDATADNMVPTLNYDATSQQPVLRNAPLYGYDTSFYTTGMRRADQVLTHMDNKMWDLKHYNTLEKLVHILHMDEVWAKTKLHYDRFKEQGVNKSLCACVSDVNNNGIINLLHFMTLKIRYPGLTTEKLMKLEDGRYVDMSGNLYTYIFFVEMSPELLQFNFTQDVEDNLRRAYGVLVDNDKGMKHLDSEKQWQIWKKGMKSVNEQDNYELAMFLYCALNQEKEFEHELVV